MFSIQALIQNLDKMSGFWTFWPGIQAINTGMKSLCKVHKNRTFSLEILELAIQIPNIKNSDVGCLVFTFPLQRAGKGSHDDSCSNFN